MTENTPEPVAESTLVDAPEVPEGDRTGRYAVYNRTLGQYVEGVTAKRPSKADADKRVPEGHVAAVVEV